MLSLSSIHLETKFPEHHISSCSCGTCGSNNNNKSTIPDKIPIETVPPCGCLANGGPGKLTLIELARLERDLDSLPKWLKILRMSTNPIFLLWVMVDLFTKDPREIERRRQVVKMELQQLRSRSILNNEGRMLDKKFTDITAKDLAMVFDLIDREFFGGAIAAVFKFHKRLLEFRVVGDTVLPTQAGSFSRSGIRHFISISGAMLERAFTPAFPHPPTVCGMACFDRLDCLVRVMEHEMVHLIVYTNWSVCEEPHGEEFISVSRAFFRHISSTHGLPVLAEHLTLYRQAAAEAIRNNTPLITPVYAGVEYAAPTTFTAIATPSSTVSSAEALDEDDPEAGIPIGPYSSLFVAFDYPGSEKAATDAIARLRNEPRLTAVTAAAAAATIRNNRRFQYTGIYEGRLALDDHLIFQPSLALSHLYDFSTSSLNTYDYFKNNNNNNNNNNISDSDSNSNNNNNRFVLDDDSLFENGDTTGAPTTTNAMIMEIPPASIKQHIDGGVDAFSMDAWKPVEEEWNGSTFDALYSHLETSFGGVDVVVIDGQQQYSCLPDQEKQEKKKRTWSTVVLHEQQQQQQPMKEEPVQKKSK